MPRRLAPLLSLTVAACASAGTPAPGAEPTPAPTTNTTYIVGSGGAMGLTTASADRRNARLVAVAIDRAWEALPATYAALGIDYTTLDKTRWTIGNDALKLRRKLGNAPLTRLLDCGGTQANPNAATYEVTLAIHTALSSSAEGESKVLTTVSGSAKSLAFVTDAVNCASTGELEKRIATTIAVEAAKLAAR